MKVLSQRDPKWAKIKLGKCGVTLGSHGCAVTAVAMLAGTTPDKVNAKKPFVGSCMDLMDWAKAAKLFNLNYSPVRNKAVSYPTIAEVKLSGYQHFIVVEKNGNQLDPWTGKVTKGYKIVSYRNVTQRPVKKVVTPIVTPTPKVTPVTPPKPVIEKPTESIKEVIIVKENPIMKYTLTKENLVKIAKGAGIALGGALLAYVAEILPQVDFGVWTGLVAALSAVLINAARQFIKE